VDGFWKIMSMNAKRKFLVKFGEGFKHEVVYNVLKKSGGLPKYKISMAAIDLRVRRALFFCDNDNEVSVVDDGEGGDVAVAPAEGAEPVARPPGMGMCTPRPSIAKKKAKANEYDRKQQILASNIKKKQRTVVELANADVVAERSSYLASLVAAAKLKNDLVQQQFAYHLFMHTPDAVELQAFFAAMRKKYSAKKYMVVVVDKDEDKDIVEFVESVECNVVHIVDDTDNRDNDGNDEEVIEEQRCKEHFDELGQ
jgi:hypothetical protein